MTMPIMKGQGDRGAIAIREHPIVAKTEATRIAFSDPSFEMIQPAKKRQIKPTSPPPMNARVDSVEDHPNCKVVNDWVMTRQLPPRTNTNMNAAIKLRVPD